MAIERIGPYLAVSGNIAGLYGVDALSPGLVLAPPDVAAHRDIDTIVIEYRHTLDIARAFFAVSNVLVHILFWRRRITIESPNSFQVLPAAPTRPGVFLAQDRSRGGGRHCRRHWRGL